MIYVKRKLLSFSGLNLGEAAIFQVQYRGFETGFKLGYTG